MDPLTPAPSSFDFRALLVIASVFFVVFVLARALDAAELGQTGVLLSLSTALLLGAFVIQGMRTPGFFTEWKGIGFFSILMAASAATSAYVHHSIYGARL